MPGGRPHWDRYYRGICRKCQLVTLTPCLADVADWQAEGEWLPGVMVLAVCPRCLRRQTEGEGER
jgi:hypothetical protein